MGRRKYPAPLAAVIAVVGHAMVFLYVQGADDRAKEQFDPVAVLKAVSQIEPGESLRRRRQAGKIELVDVPKEERARRLPDRPRSAWSGGVVAQPDLPERAGHRADGATRPWPPGLS